MGLVSRLLYSLNVGKIKQIDRAVRLVKDGRPQQALEVLGGLKRSVNMAFRYLYHLARAEALDAVGRYAEAEEELRESLAFKPQNPSTLLLHAYVLARLFRHEEARQQIAALEALEGVPAQMLERAASLKEVMAVSESSERTRELRAEAEQLLVHLGIGPHDDAVLPSLDAIHQRGELPVDGDRLTALTTVVGDAIVGALGGAWEVNIDPVASRVRVGRHIIRPVEVVQAVLTGQQAGFADAVENLKKHMDQLH